VSCSAVIWLGKSPFRPDRNHLHHLFVRAGYRVSDVGGVAAVAIQLVSWVLIGIYGLS
jgi:hypothetical protein